MHALPLAAPDPAAALMAGGPAPAGPAPNGEFHTHLSAAAGARPDQPVQTAGPGRQTDSAPAGDPAADTTTDSDLSVAAREQEADAAPLSPDPANGATLATAWFPWPANAGAERPTDRAAGSLAANTDTGSAMGRLLAAIVTRADSRPAVPAHNRETAAPEQAADAARALPAPTAAVEDTSTVAVPARAVDADPQGRVRFVVGTSPAARAREAAVAAEPPATPPAARNTPPPALPEAAASTAQAVVTRNAPTAASAPATTAAPVLTPEVTASATAAGEQALTPPQAHTPASAPAQTVAPQVAEVRFGRVFTVEQTAPAEGELSRTVVTQTAPATASQETHQEVADVALRSSLGNDAPAGVRADAGPQQDPAGNAAGQHNTPAESADGRQTEPVQAGRIPFTLAPDEQPLFFAHQREAAAPTAAGAAGGESAGLRLPSGLIVPDSTVMDQMLTHLSLQRRLASSTVHLRLNPQELGELRMEIKVEQDNIKAHIIAQNPQAQEMIDRHLPRLREALEQQGLHLQQVSVTLAGGDHTDSQRFHDNFNRHPGSGGPQGVSTPLPFAPSATTTAQPATAPAGGVNVVA